MLRLCAAVLPVIICAVPAQALDFPARKAGLWEMKMSMEGGAMPATVMQHCVDAATDRQMQQMGANMRTENCSRQDVRRSGSTITIDSVCRLGDVTTTSQGTVTGSFDSGYTMKMTSKRAGGPPVPGMPAETRMTIEAKWTGACKSDQKPGDVIMPNGMKMNVGDLQKGMPPGTKK